MSTLPIEDKPNTASALADLYEVSPKVFRNWLKPLADELGEKVGHYFTPRQIEIIKKHLGLPPSLNKSTEAPSPPATETGENEEGKDEKKESQRSTP